MDLNKFDWGMFNEDISHKSIIEKEIFEDRLYETDYKVKENDVVLDIGASVGPFAYSILDRKCKQIICVEPSEIELPTLNKNINQPNTKIEPSAIFTFSGNFPMNHVYGYEESKIVKTISFSDLVSKYKLGTINLIKIDCEGGEWDIFTPSNLMWIKSNVKNIVGELHLNHPNWKEKFREFKGLYLKMFPNYKLYNVKGKDITNLPIDEKFINYYNQILFYINNEE